MRKKLLSEAQVRRFQSLASIKPLNEMDSSYARDDEDEAAMKDDYMEGKEDMDEALYEEDEDMDLDKDEDKDMGEADVELDEELVDQFMDAVKTIEQVADALGGASGGEDMDMGGDDLDMGGDDAPMELDAGDEKEPEEDEEEMLQEALRGISYVPSQKEVVKLVAKRVARRLQEAKRAEHRLNRALGKRR
tara:strand:+ start:330 stop:902 length:573 start_codon:yes stop_codon:yes gene_type:complete